MELTSTIAALIRAKFPNAGEAEVFQLVAEILVALADHQGVSLD